MLREEVNLFSYLIKEIFWTYSDLKKNAKIKK